MGLGRLALYSLALQSGQGVWAAAGYNYFVQGPLTMQSMWMLSLIDKIFRFRLYIYICPPGLFLACPPHAQVLFDMDDGL